jgi:ComEC/Rec2-related protein
MPDVSQAQTSAADLPEHVQRNREHWDEIANEYLEPGRRNWSTHDISWGIWGIGESEVHLLPDDVRGLLPGLVVGDTSRTPLSLTDAMLATGMTHLSAVSGSNVAVVLAAAMGLCQMIGVRRRWRPPVGLLLLTAFVVLARPEPSVLRAGVMGVIGLLGLSASRRRMGVPALSGAVLVLLCIDPWLSRSFGFALSTLATLGLLLFARAWGQWFAQFLPLPLKGLGLAIAERAVSVHRGTVRAINAVDGGLIVEIQMPS